MRCPAQDATGGWVMLGLVFKWFPLCEFSLFETPQGRGSLVVCHLWGCMELDMTEVMQQKQQQQRYFSGCLGSWSQCSHSKGSGLDLWSGRRIPKQFVMAFSEIKTDIPKQETKDEAQTDGDWQLQNQQMRIKIMKCIHIHP